MSDWPFRLTGLQERLRQGGHQHLLATAAVHQRDRAVGEELGGKVKVLFHHVGVVLGAGGRAKEEGNVTEWALCTDQGRR